MRLVTVEPVLFSYIFTAGILSPLLQQYIYDQVSKQHNFTKSEDEGLCINGSKNSTDDAALEKRIQSEASYWFIGLVISSSLPSIFTTLLFGSMSDAIGRKPVISTAIVGALIKCFITSMTVTLGWPFYVIFFGSFVDGLMGSYGSLLGCCMAYVADITDYKSRSTRFGILEVVYVFAVMASFFTGGIWLKNSGYVQPFWTSVGLLLLCIIYIVKFLPESLKEKQNFNKFSFLANAKRIKNFVLTKRSPYINMCLVLCLISLIFTLLDYFGNVTVLYTKHYPLCWNSEMIGFYIATKAAAAGIGTVFTFKVIAKYTRDTLIVILGCVFFMASDVITAFSKTTLLMFLSCIPAFFLTVAPPAIRSISSKLVQPQEEGAICSLLAVTETLASILGPLIINTIYPVGLNEFDFAGFVFLLEAGLFFIPIILFSIIHYYIQRNVHLLYDSLAEFNEKAQVQAQVPA